MVTLTVLADAHAPLDGPFGAALSGLTRKAAAPEPSAAGAWPAEPRERFDPAWSLLDGRR